MRTTLFAVLTMLLAVSALPFLSNDVVAVQARSSNTVLVWYGKWRNEVVEIVGEWDWSAPISMSENNGVWSADIALEEGLYCYKFIVDGTYVFVLQIRNVRIAGITKTPSLVRNQSRPTYSAALNGDALHVKYHPGTSGAAHDGTCSP